MEENPSPQAEPHPANQGTVREVPTEVNGRNFWPGFAWGLSAGALAVVAIIGVAIAVGPYLAFRNFNRTATAGAVQDRVVVSPVTAGSPWFSVSPAGKGVMTAWSNGSTSGGGNGPGGSVGSIQVGTIGSVDGVAVQHLVDVNLTPSTQVVIGTQSYPKGKSASVADALVNGDGGPGGDILASRPLTIEFHRVGDAIIADKITAPLGSSSNPLQQ